MQKKISNSNCSAPFIKNDNSYIDNLLHKMFSETGIRLKQKLSLEEANIANMGPREREEGAFGEELQPVLKKLRLGEGEKKEVEGEGEELVKGGERRGVKRRHHPDTECTGATLLTL